MAHMGFQMPGMPPPQLHQPPQIFGVYGPDGMPQMQHLPPDLTAQMFPDAHLYADDLNEAKKRRIARVRSSSPMLARLGGSVGNIALATSYSIPHRVHQQPTTMCGLMALGKLDC